VGPIQENDQPSKWWQWCNKEITKEYLDNDTPLTTEQLALSGKKATLLSSRTTGGACLKSWRRKNTENGLEHAMCCKRLPVNLGG
jgi:hypothetical protein